MKNLGLKETIAPALSLFLSMGTLICCALPALFITLGMGAALAGLVSALPQLVWLSAHKTLIFSAAGAMLAVAGIAQWRAQSLPCPADPLQAKTCKRLRKINFWIYCFSLAVFITGAFFAFIAPYILI